ncbi:hypothetical protein PCANC_20984 [Puccinia coronata f. sp. avenae]|uniref:Uncharacterized protein n=1 Tax=Puccinia coronata f. sp. avenae TaxID=200324 RepID=A0A2N5TKP0_9BASI|nr:hypothetical protein PCASD_24743 [Puccinia coronata f. sp. avenae]PLW35818.1 hypothetical protein PCANC_20984 [Puccinia coronata f. sp. avenae]
MQNSRVRMAAWTWKLIRNRSNRAHCKSGVAQVISEALQAFDKWLDDDFRYGHDLHPYPREKQLTLDQLDKQIDALHDLRTVLLPATKHQLVALLQSLGLQSKQPAYPCPDPELTAKILSDMHSTTSSIISALDIVTWTPPIPDPSNDHRLQDFKQFRTTCLLQKTKRIIHHDLWRLLYTCAEWVLAWDDQGDPKDTASQTRSANTRNRISRLAVHFVILIDEVIEWSKLSDFAILQEEWQKSAQECNVMLQALSGILNATSMWRQKIDQNQPGDNQEERQAHRARAIQLAQLTMPILKLTRIFYAKLTKTATSDQFPFTLDPEISSKEHELLQDRMSTFHFNINRLVNCLGRTYIANMNMTAEIPSLKEALIESIGSLEKVLLTLAFRIAPSEATAGCSAAQVQRSFKACFFPLQKQLRVASKNLRTAANACIGQAGNGESD